MLPGMDHPIVLLYVDNRGMGVYRLSYYHPEGKKRVDVSRDWLIEKVL